MEHFPLKLLSKTDDRVVGQAFVYLYAGEHPDFEKIKFGSPLLSPSGDIILASSPVNQVPDNESMNQSCSPQSIHDLNISIKTETSSSTVCSNSNTRSLLLNPIWNMEETNNLSEEEVKSSFDNVEEKARNNVNNSVTNESVPHVASKYFSKEDMMRLSLPHQYGFLRVVSTRPNGTVTEVHYKTPTDEKGERSTVRTFSDMKEITSGLKIELKPHNFLYQRVVVGLASEFEVVKASRNKNVTAPKSKLLSKSPFLKYFTILINPRHTCGTVSCNLCNDGSTISRQNISRHIKRCHMPHEECPNCGQEFSPQNMQAHVRVCYSQLAKDGESGNSSIIKGLVFNVDNEMIREKTLVFVFGKKKTKITVGSDKKLKSLFKIIARKFQTTRDQLRFLQGGSCLSGEDLVSFVVVGENIVVEKRN